MGQEKLISVREGNNLWATMSKMSLRHPWALNHNLTKPTYCSAIPRPLIFTA
jgi:hypothetical protein